MKKVNECISMAEFLAIHGYKRKAIDFYRWALKGLHRLGISKYKKDINIINKLIKQLL